MSKVSALARGFSTFVNWFNGAAALICGIWMMLSALIDLPLSWNDWMPLSIYDPFPLHDVFFTTHFWPGLALLLINGAPNIAAIVAHRRRSSSWPQWSSSSSFPTACPSFIWLSAFSRLRQQLRSSSSACNRSLERHGLQTQRNIQSPGKLLLRQPLTVPQLLQSLVKFHHPCLRSSPPQRRERAAR